MKIFINAKNAEICENILAALDDTADSATLCSTDEQAECEISEACPELRKSL